MKQTSDFHQRHFRFESCINIDIMMIAEYYISSLFFCPKVLATKKSLKCFFFFFFLGILVIDLSGIEMKN